MNIVLLSGGSGKRLWPLSNDIRSKQFIKIFKREDTVILLGDDSNRQLNNPMETKLFHMMYLASKDGILENKEFEEWCRKSYERVLDWFDSILEEQRKNLVADGLIKYE